MSESSLRDRALPVGSFGRKSSGWYGVWTLVLTEAAVFAYLLFSYFYLASQANGSWPLGGMPALKLAAPNTLILLSSSAALIWAERSGARRGKRLQLLAGIAVAFVLGVIFVMIQLREWQGKSFSIRSGTYGSSYFVVTGFHLAHVIVGLAILMTLFIWALKGFFDPARHAPLTIGAIYWHFVDAVWLIVFFALYLVPRLG
jgi:heme/copper-type cytochrome/quinol oxidase subunit 3